MGEDEIDSRGGSRQQHRPPLGRSLIGRGLDRGWLHPRIPNQPSFRPQDHPMFNRNNAEGPPPPAGHRQRSIRERYVLLRLMYLLAHYVIGKQKSLMIIYNMLIT